jgi:hypothetical protein
MQKQNNQLIPLTPALTLDPLASLAHPQSISVSTILIHRMLDTIVPLKPVRDIAWKLFTNLTVLIIEDDHHLQKPVNGLDRKIFWHDSGVG